MRRIAFANFKGGSGKTTSAVAVAVGLARRSERVLLVDADQQANATWTMLGGQGAAGPTLADVLRRDATADETIRPTRIEGLDLLPADASLGGVNVQLAAEVGRDTRMRSALARVDGRYGFVLIDTGPQFSTVLANALVYAAEVIVPIDPGVYAVLGLVGLEETIAEVADAYSNDALHLAGLVLTKCQRNNVVRDVEAELRGRFGDRVFRATIPLAAKFEEAATRALTILEYAPKSPGAVAYEGLVEEVIGYGQRSEDGGRVAAVGRAGAAGAA